MYRLTRKSYLSPGRDVSLEVTVEGDRLARGGMVMNSAELKELIASRIGDRSGTEKAPGPTGPAFLDDCRRRLSGGLPPGVRLFSLVLGEGSGLSYRMDGEGTLIRITLSADFSAAHRLHSPELSAEDNKRLFGKCNNPSGHGHNYVVEATLEGALDPRTGRAADVETLQSLVQSCADRFDHKHLNEDCAEFKNLNPTAENVSRVLFELIKPKVLPAKLVRVGVRETEKNYFEYEETTD